MGGRCACWTVHQIWQFCWLLPGSLLHLPVLQYCQCVILHKCLGDDNFTFFWLRGRPVFAAACSIATTSFSTLSKLPDMVRILIMIILLSLLLLLFLLSVVKLLHFCCAVFNTVCAVTERWRLPCCLAAESKSHR